MKKVIGAAKFKEQCLQILDHIDEEGLIITKNGKPVAKLISIDQDKNSAIGRFKAMIKIHGSLLSTGAKWNAES